MQDLITPPFLPAFARSVLLRPSRELFDGAPPYECDTTTTSLSSATSFVTVERIMALSGSMSLTTGLPPTEGR